MTDLLEDLREQIDRLKQRDLYRSLREPSGVDFSSNDYLGLGTSTQFASDVLQRMAGKILSAPASRLLRGNTQKHEELERRIATFKGTEAALLFPSGYQANVGLLSAVVTKQDRVLTDALNHASIIDGIRLTRARKVIFPHRDIDSIERAFRTPHPDGRTFLITESLFSMDGDIAPLDRYADIVDEYGGVLIVDDAHATGIYGDERGSGLVEDFGVASRVFAVTSTFGKAFGVAGAAVAGSRTLIDYLINRCRAFVFTTAPSPLLLFAIDAALDTIRDQPHLRRRVISLANRLRERLERGGVSTPRIGGPIVPVIIGEADKSLAIAAEVQRRGFDVRAIRPPTVPRGTSRLRVSVHADHSEEQIDSLAETLVLAVNAATAV